MWPPRRMRVDDLASDALLGKQPNHSSHPADTGWVGTEVMDDQWPHVLVCQHARNITVSLPQAVMRFAGPALVLIAPGCSGRQGLRRRSARWRSRWGC